MRQLYPTKASTSINVINSKPITQEQYNVLLAQIQDYETNVDNIDAAFTQLKNDLQSAWTTQTLTADLVNAITACFNNIVTTTVQADTVQASNTVFAPHFQGNTAYLQCLTAACRVNTNVVDANCGVITTRIDTSCIITDDITVNNAVHYSTSCTDIANITNANISCETVLNSEIQTASIHDLSSDTAQLDLACINTANITNADVANQLDTYRLTAEFIKHNKGAQAQTLVTPDDFYIELPYFSNGSYRLISKDTQENELWSIEVHNEISNFYLTWSRNVGAHDSEYLHDAYIYQASPNNPQIFIHGHSNGKAQTIYHISDTLENEIDPTIYTDGWPFDTTSEDVLSYFVFPFNHGSKYFRNVEFSNGTMVTSPLNIVKATDVEDVNLPVQYDSTEIVYACIYQPDQNVDTCSCAQFNRITLCDNIDPDTGVVTSESLGTFPHVNISCTVCSPHLFIGTTAKYNSATLANDAIVILTDEV